MSHKYTHILEELYQIEPSLKEKESELITLIENMLQSRPKATIDEGFKKALRKEVLTLIEVQHRPKKSYIAQNIFLPLGLSIGFAALFGLWLYNPLTFEGQKNVPWELAFTPTIIQAGSQAFWTKIIAENTASVPQAIPASELSTISSKRIATDMMMPYEPTWYRYVYTGSLESLATETQVYQVQRTPLLSDEIISFIQRLDFTWMNLASLKGLSDLEVTNLSLVEKKRYGYQINIDFQNGSVNLYQNYPMWNCEGKKCDTPLSVEDVPSDDVMIARAQDFLESFGIDPSAYGSPYIEQSFPMIAYARAENAPSTVERQALDMYNIIFPIEIDWGIVHQEYGGKKWLSLTYDVRSGRISSLSGLEKTTYTASAYPVISETKKLQDMIRSGGRYIQDESQFGTGKVVDIPLGTPTRGYVSLASYDNKTQTNREYLAPALIFPILQKPENWYGQNQVIIPLIDIE